MSNINLILLDCGFLKSRDYISFIFAYFEYNTWHTAATVCGNGSQKWRWTKKRIISMRKFQASRIFLNVYFALSGIYIFHWKFPTFSTLSFPCCIIAIILQLYHVLSWLFTQHKFVSDILPDFYYSSLMSKLTTIFFVKFLLPFLSSCFRHFFLLTSIAAYPPLNCRMNIANWMNAHLWAWWQGLELQR